MSHQEFSKRLINYVGKEKNITDVSQCITRLRIIVKDKSVVQIDEIEKEKVVQKVQYKGNELQVVIGPEVNDVYDAFIKEVKLEDFSQADGEGEKSGNILSKVIDFLGGIFVPIIPALVAGGMIKSISTLLTFAGIADPASDIITILNIAGDSVFYFLPFFIAVTAARVIKTSEVLALMVAGSLMYPTLINGLESGASALTVFGISMPVIAYNGSVFPIILGVFLLKYVYAFFNKYIHKNVRMVFAPLLTILIVVPLTLAFLAPIGHYLGIYLARGVTWIFNTNGVIASLIMGFFMPLIVMAGMHQSLFPLMLNNLAEFSVDALLPIFYLQTLAMAGATFAVFFATKDKDMKSTALSTGISAAFGITEPALYGVAIVLKKPLTATLIASGIGSGLSYLLGVRAYAFGLPSFFSIPTYVNPEQGSTLSAVIIASLVTLALGFVLSFISMKSDKNTQVETIVANSNDTSTSVNEAAATKVEVKKAEPVKVTKETENLYSPVDDGRVIPLAEVNDAVFAQEIVGPTVAIKASNGMMYSPVNGEVALVTDTQHAVGLVSETGLELILHFGIDTVKLSGEPFTVHVEKGDKIKAGDLIAEVDLEYLHERDIDDTIIVAVTNFKEMKKLVSANEKINKDTLILNKNV